MVTNESSLAHFLGIHLAVNMSVNGIPCHYQIYMTEYGARCCNPIICQPGSEAVMCRDGDPLTSHCQKCSHITYRADRSILGRNDRCHYKQLCEGGRRTYLFPGNETHNSECTCDPGYQLTSDGHLCLPSRESTTPNHSVGWMSTPVSSSPDTGITTAVVVLCALLGLSLFIVLLLCARRLSKRRQNPDDDMGLESQVTYCRVPNSDSNKLLYDKVASIKDHTFHSTVLDGKVTELIETKLGRSLGPFIRQLYRQIGQADTATRLLEELQLEPVCEERAHRALQSWRQAAGRAATVEDIRQALLAANRKDLVDEVYGWIVNQPPLVEVIDDSCKIRCTDENKNINQLRLNRISSDYSSISIGTEV